MSKEKRLAGLVLNSQTETDIVRNLVEIERRSKSPEEIAKERDATYHIQRAMQRRKENELRYGKRRIYSI